MRGILAAAAAVVVVTGCGFHPRDKQAVSVGQPAQVASASPSAAVDAARVCPAWRNAVAAQTLAEQVATRSYDVQTAVQHKFETDMTVVATGLAGAPPDVREAAAELRAEVTFHPSESSPDDAAKAERIHAAMVSVDRYLGRPCSTQ